MSGVELEEYDTPLGVAVLSADPDDGPLRVRGVALSENDVTYGASGTRKFWSRDVIEPSVEGLVGTKIVDDREHDIPDDGDISDIPKQPSVEAIVGEVTDAKYEDGIGVVYEGEVDDPDIAALVRNGRVDVSPFIFHHMGAGEGEDNVRPVKNIGHWRDLAVVSEGAGTQASIDPAENDDSADESESEITLSSEPQQPRAAAMSAAALTAVLDTSFNDSVTTTPSEETEDDDDEPETETETETADGESADDGAGGADGGEGDADADDVADDGDAVDVAALASFNHLEHDGTSGGKLDESAISSDSFKSHYLFPGETKSDSSFPVVDAEGTLRRGNVDAAWGLRGQAPVSKEDIEQILVTLAEKFENPPVTREDAEALQSNEPAATATAGGSSGVDDDTTTTDMDLTEAEEKLVNKARAIDNATVVEADVEGLADEAEELEIDQYEEPQVIEGEEYDDPHVVESEEYDDLSGRVELIEEFMASRLAERTGMKEETAGALSLGAMFAEFEDEEGEFDAEALVQDPASGDAGGDTSSPDDTEDTPEVDAEQEEEIEEEIAVLEQKVDVLGNTSIASDLEEQLEALKQQKEEI